MKKQRCSVLDEAASSSFSTLNVNHHIKGEGTLRAAIHSLCQAGKQQSLSTVLALSFFFFCCSHKARAHGE